MIEVTDDSGFLALVDPDAYQGFVGEDWTFEALVAHLEAAMSEQRLLIWGTGLEGFWRVEVSTAGTAANAFREISGPIEVSAGRLLLTNYESLTMAAQFRDVSLPEDHQRDQVISLAPGTYNCRILQLFDPDEDLEEGEGPDFVLEILPAEAPAAAWQKVPWSDL